MKKPALILSTVLALCACDNEAERLAHHEKACLTALDHGLLESADSECTKALGDSGLDNLDRHTLSERLFRLGSIKRQRALYAEAVSLVSQTLIIEEQSSNPDVFQIARRHHELTLALAGQENWLEGAVLVEKLLRHIDLFSEKEQKSIINMTRLYVVNLKKNQREEHARKLEISINR